ncbi:hypothetical protein LINPERHAP1_LOCUS6472 [Linum perenne]
MQIMVHMDVRLPLKREKKIRKPGGDWTVVAFKYECLPTFCFTCGRIGHINRRYELCFLLASNEIVQKWSADLRAPIRRRGGGTGGERWLVEDDEGIGGTAFGQSSGQLHKGKGVEWMSDNIQSLK